MTQMTPAEVAKYKKRIINPDGSVSTERSITVNFDNDKFYYNIPSIWEGKQLSREEAILMAKKEGLENFPKFDNLDKAIAAAKKRSDEIGREIRKLNNKV